MAADDVEIRAGEDGRQSNVEADWTFELFFLCLNFALDKLYQLQVELL